MEQKIDYNGFSYRININQENKTLEKLDILHNITEPKHLCKYYSLSNFSIDAVLNHYFYATHPKDLNDKHDCSAYLIDYSNCNLSTFIKKIHEAEKTLYNRIESTEEIIKKYFHSSEKWRLERRLAELNAACLFSLFGIISLTSVDDNVLMWAHYAQNNGFLIKIDPSLMRNDNLYGAFPINYSSKLHTIESDSSVPILNVLYQSNIKSDIWSYENEWRYLYFNPNEREHISKSNRKMLYDKTALVEFVLGFNFFESASSIRRYAEYDILKLRTKHKNYKLKRKLLNFITESGVKTFLICAETKEFSLIKNEIIIEKIGSNTFKIRYGK